MTAKQNLYPLVGTYDPRTPLDDWREQFCHELIKTNGKKKVSYLRARGLEELEKGKRNYPYLYSANKEVQARYNYLLDQALKQSRLDDKHLLLDTKIFRDKAIAEKNINDFEKVVNIVKKLTGSVNPKTASGTFIQNNFNMTKEESMGLTDFMNDNF